MTSTRICAALLCTAAILLSPRYLSAATMAFGYLQNKSGDPSYEYLETIFPNSFASSISNIFDVTVMKPAQIEARLKKKGLVLKKTFTQSELKPYARAMKADYFIYGSFAMQPGDVIAIKLHLYQRKKNKLFTFTNQGKMETEIFRLVDRITRIMVQMLASTNTYRSRPVPLKSRVAVLANLDDEQLNRLYYRLFQKGYLVSGIQGNGGKRPLDAKLMEMFKHITANENSYEIVSSPDSLRFLTGTWAGEKHQARIAEYRRFFKDYDREFMATKAKTLDRLNARGGADYMLIIGFERKKAWLRCVDLRKKELIWIQSNIRGSKEKICTAIVDAMDALPAQPAEKK